MKKTIFTDKAPKPIGPYSQAIVSDSPFVFTAGQIPIDPKTGQLASNDIKSQTRQVLLNLQAILEAAGTSMRSVVKTTVFLADMNEFASMNEIYDEFFRDAAPARSTVQVSHLPRDVKIEIEAIAIVEKS